MSNEDVCVLIPALNEEATIGQLIKDFRSEGFDNILVIDGHSSDRTRDIAEAEGAEVVVQSGRGKGQAIQEAFELINSDYVVMIDGDGTYLASDIHVVLKPLREGLADQVIGNRFADYDAGAFTRLNRMGNRILNKFFGFAYGQWLDDILSGYRGYTRRAIKSFELQEIGFEIESEMTIESVKRDHRIEVVPISYLERHSKASTKLNPVKDGFRIARTIYKMAKMHNPMFYFGLIGGFFILAGFITGLFVISEWLQGITRIPLSVLTALLIIAGFQMFVFGMLSDLVVSLHREHMRALRKLSEDMNE
ncbi:S-layer glycoprotein N-glycosyltransferase AglJ [Methanolobus halotolerans]|uniref:TIGR04182 family glycosyltransferase n=1 Tax=Methanolobus halotolerans TaxID=2052935 RepID=A0A4E0Q7Q6_9EURY|nr:S-layer glycoprotein N-glycosyltransferase AglJ [Methanolobus halotolerans]TGC07287.1 TIGR04182 family glycosyltransferase [Methanolobus halotolerans]